MAAEFTVGETPSATKLNAICAEIAAVDTGTSSGRAVVMGSQAAREPGIRWTFLHLRRYLVYRSTGTLMDFAGVQPDVNLSEGEDGWGYLDLDTIGWLKYGQLYIVEGCLHAMEDTLSA